MRYLLFLLLLTFTNSYGQYYDVVDAPAQQVGNNNVGSNIHGDYLIDVCLTTLDSSIINAGLLLEIPQGKSQISYTFYDEDVEILPSNILSWSFGPCRTKESDCKRYIPIYFVFDNSGTNASNENTFRVYYGDGTYVDIVQLPQVNGAPGGSKWTNQFLELERLISEEYLKKCNAFSIETRFNPRINGVFTESDLSNYNPPDGLLVPPTELWGTLPNMQYRYMQINSCSTCTPINRVELIAVNGTPINFDMTSKFSVGKEVRYDICQECTLGGIDRMYWYQQTDNIVPEADLPVCLLECNEDPPSVPDSGCIFTTEVVCDSRGTSDEADDVLLTKRYQDCGDGQLQIAYLVDEDGGSVLYEDLLDDSHIVICGTTDSPEDPIPVIVLDEYDREDICIDNGDGTYSQAWEVSSIQTDGTLVITYADESGTIPEPNNWSVGICYESEDCLDYTTYVGKLWRTAGAIPGATIDWWAPTSFPPSSNAAPHGNVSSIFSVVSDKLVHVNGAPDVTYSESSFYFDSIDPDFVSNVGANSTAETSGTDQFLVKAYVLMPRPGIIQDSSPSGRTGERGGIWVNECCQSGLLLSEERTTDTGSNDRGVFNGTPLPAGTHYIEVAVSDFTSWADLGLSVSYDDGVTFEALNTFQTKPYYECVPVYRCNTTEELYHGETGELIVLEDFDTWCKPEGCDNIADSSPASNVNVSNFPRTQNVEFDYEKLAQIIVDTEQQQQTQRTTQIYSIVNSSDVEQLPVPAGTIGCLKVIEDFGTGFVRWTIDGTNPTTATGTTFTTTGPYHASYNLCGIDLSLLRFDGSSTASDYSIIYEIWN